MCGGSQHASKADVMVRSVPGPETGLLPQAAVLEIGRTFFVCATRGMVFVRELDHNPGRAPARDLAGVAGTVGLHIGGSASVSLRSGGHQIYL